VSGCKQLQAPSCWGCLWRQDQKVCAQPFMDQIKKLNDLGLVLTYTKLIHTIQGKNV
jgi:hypothetical protein